MPQFNGFLPPTENWSKLPHQLIDALPLVKTIGEMKVILYVLRHTWGFGDDEKRITTDEFEHGRKRRDGSRLDNGTGLTAPTIRDGIEQAVEHGFITVEVDDRDPARVKKYYRLAEWHRSSEVEKDLPPVEKDLPPDGKTLSIGPKESFHLEKDSLPRTEKETDREKPLEETMESGDPHLSGEAESPKELTKAFVLKAMRRDELNGDGERFDELWEICNQPSFYQEACEYWENLHPRLPIGFLDLRAMIYHRVYQQKKAASGP